MRSAQLLGGRMRVALIVGLVACKREPDVSTPCGAMEATLRSCEQPLPSSALDSFHEGCEAYVSYDPPASDKDSLAVLAKRAIESCIPAKSCKELSKCLSDHKCMWFSKSSEDHAPTFSCM